MPKRIDFTGKTVGYLAVRSLAEKVKGVRARKWICDCTACGRSCELSATEVREGRQTSCGCKPRLTVRGFDLVKQMRASGERLVKTLPNLSDAPDVCFFLEPSGKSVPRPDAESAIDAHEVQPLGDGLFVETAQTWVPA